MSSRRAVDIAILLLGAGIALLMPPLVLIFNRPLNVFGLPLPALYIFGVWLILLIGAIVLARILPAEGE